MWGVGETIAEEVGLWHHPELMSRAGLLEREMLISASSWLPISLKFCFQCIILIFVFYYLTCSEKVIHIRAGPRCPNSPKDTTANLKEFFCHKELLRKECDNSSIKLPDKQSKYFPGFPQGIWKFLCIQIPSSEGVCIIFYLYISPKTNKQTKTPFFPSLNERWSWKSTNSGRASAVI